MITSLPSSSSPYKARLASRWSASMRVTMAWISKGSATGRIASVTSSRKRSLRARCLRAAAARTSSSVLTKRQRTPSRALERAPAFARVWPVRRYGARRCTARLHGGVRDPFAGEPRRGGLDRQRAHVPADERAPEPRRGDQRGPAAAHQIGDALPRRARRADDALQQLLRLLRGVAGPL